MPLQSSGQISLANIAGEFGGSAPHQMSEYRGKGNAPTSGLMRLGGHFHGTSDSLAPHTVNIGAAVYDSKELVWSGSTASSHTLVTASGNFTLNQVTRYADQGPLLWNGAIASSNLVSSGSGMHNALRTGSSIGTQGSNTYYLVGISNLGYNRLQIGNITMNLTNAGGKVTGSSFISYYGLITWYVNGNSYLSVQAIASNGSSYWRNIGSTSNLCGSGGLFTSTARNWYLHNA